MPDDEVPQNALSRLTSVSRALTNAVSIDEVLDITLDCAADLLEADRIVLMLREQDDLLRIRAARGIPEEVMDRFREPLDETLLTRLSALFGPGAGAGFLGVPLVVGGRITGLLAVLSPEPHPPSEREEWLLSALADQAAVALENARAESLRSSLERRVEELRAEGATREDALRMVGHDLRSPLNALQGYIQLLQIGTYGPVTEPQRGALDRLAAIGRHLESLVSNVMEMGRLAAGTLTIEREPVRLADVVDQAEVLVSLSAEGAGVALDAAVPAGLAVQGDADRIRQVLVQLLDNAIKYAPSDSTVTLRAARESGARGEEPRVAIRVADRGPGVPPEEAETIFEPYHQLPSDATAGGIGLGLAIARALVELMGGTLALEPGTEPGATFVLRLEEAGNPDRG